MIKDAIISECGKYRYMLKRQWDDRKGMVTWVLLNPSTADAREDDPTVRRCMGFAARWGYGGIYIVNLNPYRVSIPDFMEWDLPPLVWQRNKMQWIECRDNSQLVVFGWGGYVEKIKYSAQPSIAGCFDKPRCLGLTKKGNPVHPLYIPYSRGLIPFTFSPRPASPTPTPAKQF